MKKSTTYLATLAVAAAPAFAAEPNPEMIAEMEALSGEMIGRGLQHFTSVGRAQAEIDFNNKTPEWYGEAYHVHMFGMGVDCLVWADNVFPEFVGTDFCQAVDYNGFAFGAYIINNLTPDGTPLVVRLEFDNPDTGETSPSVGTCVQADPDNILCSWTNG